MHVFRSFRPVFILLMVLCMPLALHSQSLLRQGQPKINGKSEIDSTSNITPIALTDINLASREAYNLISGIKSKKMSIVDRQVVAAEVDSVFNDAKRFLSDTSYLDYDTYNFRELESLSGQISMLRQNINRMINMINDRLKQYQEQENQVLESRKRWNLTRTRLLGEDAPLVIKKRVEGVISQLDSVMGVIDNDIDFLLTQADRVTDQQIRLEQLSANVSAYSRLISKKVFRQDAPPIWGPYQLEKGSGIGMVFRGAIRGFKKDTVILFNQHLGKLLVNLFVFVLLLMMILWIRGNLNEKNIRSRAARFNLYLREIFHMPVEVALVLTLYLLRLTIPEMPASYRMIFAIISVYPIIRIALDILPSEYRKYLFEFTGAYVLIRFYGLFYDQAVFTRILLLVTQGLAFFFLLRFILFNRSRKVRAGSFFNYIFRGLGAVFAFSLFMAFIFNVIGKIGRAHV